MNLLLVKMLVYPSCVVVDVSFLQNDTPCNLSRTYNQYIYTCTTATVPVAAVVSAAVAAIVAMMIRMLNENIMMFS